jgi:hypothetical protein
VASGGFVYGTDGPAFLKRELMGFDVDGVGTPGWRIYSQPEHDGIGQIGVRASE